MIHTPHSLTPAEDALAIQRDGVALAYTDTGHGTPPVVLIDGLCDSRRVMAPLASQMADRHGTVTTDLRGHGASDAPEGDSRWRLSPPTWRTYAMRWGWPAP